MTVTWLGPTEETGAFSSPGDEPVHASFTLEACRLTLGTTLPIDGKFICPDAMYTTGNLGKSWNELDLVPHRVTTTLGSQDAAETDYTITLAADGVTNGRVGYDVLSAAVLNAAKSHASCAVTSSATDTKGTHAAPFGGGTDTVIYRDFSIHQNKGTTCVFDWYQRLALTSHEYPGSSLQSYMFQQAGLSGSKKTLSIPVNQIEPQSIAKDMSASQTQDYVWNVTKRATPDAVHFADSCLPGGRVSPSISITVSWDRLEATPGMITLITHVMATNPSARSITTTVTDRIYKGSTQVDQVIPTEAADSPTSLTETVVVPAFSTVPVIDFVGTVPAGTASSFNDVATASYVDEVTGVPIPQTIQATASAIASVNTSVGTNATATVVDTESISAGFHFTVTNVSGASGAFAGYALNTSTTGPVVWKSGVLTGDGSVTFTKTITADGPSYVTADDDKKLTDTAALTGNGGFAATASADVRLTSGATLRVGVDKTMPAGVTGAQSFGFDVYRSAAKVGSITVPITPPATSGSGSLSVAATGSSNAFTVKEPATDPWLAQPDQDVTITLPNCAGAVAFANSFDPASAKVKKVTVPAGNESGWEFTLDGPGTPFGGEKVVTTGTGYVHFVTPLAPGDYTITETAKDGFDVTSTVGACSFTVVYPADAGRRFACTYTNTQRGSLAVTKTVDWNGATPDPSQTFAICISGPSYPAPPNCKNADSDGATLTWNNLLPGAYVVTESDPGSSWVVSGGDGATAPVAAGEKTTAQGITNTRRLGSLQVTKAVDWNGVTPDQDKTFAICISGPSYPGEPNCKNADFDGATLTWSNLIPGDYTASESNPGSSWTVAGSPSDVITVPSDGTVAEYVPVIANTRKLGSLQVTKSVDWNGVTPDSSQAFEICITGPSHPDGDCKTAGFDGATLTWSNLIPGTYTAAETDPGSAWTVAGSPTNAIVVPSDGGRAANARTITNTRKLGSLEVTKTVNWSGVTPNDAQTFEICITGASHPGGDCKTADFDGATLRWNNLIPGDYAITENGLSTAWFKTGDTSATVPTNGGAGSAEVVNTRKVGALQVVKTVDWNGVTPDDEQTFEICITGPSFPDETSCKTADSDGATLRWNNLIPGAYALTEPGLGDVWVRSGDDAATVPTDGGTGTAEVVNTRKLGSLKVTKTVDWNGVVPVDGDTFSICIEGPSYPDADCKTFTSPDGLEQTWTDLIPGEYDVSEADLDTSWIHTGDDSATVPDDGGQADATLTNTRKLGSLKVTKVVNWNGLTPDEEQTFDICITGPSHPDGDCKAIGFEGGTLEWTDLIPGNYAAGERNPGLGWVVTSSVTGPVTVPADGGEADEVALITNTVALGRLEVTKVVDWNNTPVVATQTFEICITGRSHPTPTLANGGCQRVGAAGGVLTWSGLTPGVYAVSEADPGNSWTAGVAQDRVLVRAGGVGEASVTNTHLPAEALGEQLARTGDEGTLPLVLAAVVLLLLAAQRVRRSTN